VSGINSACGFSIPGTPEFVKKARNELAAFLTSAGLPDPVVDDAVTAGCELVTNAVMHSASGLVGGEVSVHAVVAPYSWAQVDVSDQGPIASGSQRSPHQQVSRGAEGGLGRFIVAGLSAELGDYTAADGRHVTWFRITWSTSSEGSRRDG
jgi:anti-sigma regulatory factor (Ser/Thr protein kinase)